MIGKVQKNAIDLAVSKNATSVVITRTLYELKEGAREKSTETLDAQNILLYPKLSPPNKRRDDAGSADLTDWGGLAPSTANVAAGESTIDSFSIVGVGTFEIRAVHPIAINGTINGYVLEIKRIV